MTALLFLYFYFVLRDKVIYVTNKDINDNSEDEQIKKIIKEINKENKYNLMNKHKSQNKIRSIKRNRNSLSSTTMGTTFKKSFKDKHLENSLSYKLKDKELIVLDNLDVKSNKTKDMKNILNNLKAERNVLIVVNELTDDIILSTRNLDYVLLLEASEINTLDVVSADVLIVTKDAVKTIEEALA